MYTNGRTKTQGFFFIIVV